MNFNKKSMKYAVAIFTVFAISGLLYTSSITQYGFAQNNSSGNSTSSSGSGSQGNSSSGGSSGGQQNGIGTAAEMHNLTGAGTQQILSNNTSISNSSLSKLGNESTTPPPSQGKSTPQSQPFPTQNQAAGQSGNQSLSGQNVGQSQNQSSSSGGQQSSGGAGQSQNQSSNPLDMLTKLFSGGK